MKSDMLSYTLGYLDDEILAHGPDKLLRQLLLVPGACRRGDPHLVSLPGTRENFLAVEAVASPADVSDTYKEARSQALAPTLNELRGLAHALHRVPAVAKDLLPHQWRFIAQFLGRQGALNASEQGTGKTRAAWMLAHLWEARRVLILCPKSLVLQWQEEFEAMWEERPEGTAIVPLMSQVERRRQLIRMAREGGFVGDRVALITNYEVLHELRAALSQWQPDCLICDESWRLKTPNAKVTKAALSLAAEIHAREGRVMLLTGTPIGNHVGDLYTQVQMVDPALVPDGKQGYSTFLHRYAQMVLTRERGFIQWKPVGCFDPAGLIRQIAPIWFRATKASCLALPPKHYRRVTLPLRPLTRRLYQQVEKEGASALGAPLCLDGELQTLIYLQRLAGGHRPRPRDEWGREWDQEPLDCPKIDWLKEWAQDTLAGNPTARAIVWCRFRTEMTRIHEALRAILGRYRVRPADGDTPDPVLEEIKREFNSRAEEGCQVIIAQWSKMAYGHNLQSCDTNVFFSHTWSYVERAQAEDRSHRHGRADAVEYVELVAEGTIDQEIMRAMDRKGDLALRLAPETVVKTG